MPEAPHGGPTRGPTKTAAGGYPTGMRCDMRYEWFELNLVGGKSVETSRPPVITTMLQAIISRCIFLSFCRFERHLTLSTYKRPLKDYIYVDWFLCIRLRSTSMVSLSSSALVPHKHQERMASGTSPYHGVPHALLREADFSSYSRPSLAKYTLYNRQGGSFAVLSCAVWRTGAFREERGRRDGRRG